MFKRIDHIEIITDQPDRTIQFYTEVLGFRVRSRDRVDRPGTGMALNLAYLELGGTTVELITYEGANVASAPTGVHFGYNMMALEVDDMAKAIEFLATKGVGVVWGPMVREHSARAEITDPNGFHIELRQWF
jgi:glyoxylase I family protein